MAGYRPTSFGPRIISLDIVRMMNFHFLEYQRDGGVSLEEIWKLSDVKFKPKQVNLIALMHWRLSNTAQNHGVKRTTLRGRQITKKMNDEGRKKWNFEA